MIKPTMSHAVDQENLNELLVSYYEGLELVGGKISNFIELHGITHRCTTSGDLAILAIAKMFDIDIRSDHEKALDWMAEYKAIPKMMLGDIKDGKCPWLKWVGK